MEWRKAFPLLVEESLQLDACLVDRGARRVEGETVANHEFEVVVEFLCRVVFTCIKLLSHRRKIHRLLDNLGVRWQFELHIIYSSKINKLQSGVILSSRLTNRLIEGLRNSEMRLSVQFLQDLATKLELLNSSIVLDALAFARFLGHISVW